MIKKKKSYVMEDLTFKNILVNCKALIYKFCQVHAVLFYVFFWLPTIILVLTSTSITHPEMWVGFLYCLETFNSYCKFFHLPGTIREWKILPNWTFRVPEIGKLLECQDWKYPRDDQPTDFIGVEIETLACLEIASHVFVVLT